MDPAYLSRLETQKSDLEQAMGELDNEISLITSSYDPNLEDKLKELRQKLEQTGAELNAVETSISRYAGTLTISTAPVDPDKFLDFTGDTMGIFTDPKGNIVSLTTRPGTGIQYPTNTGAVQDMTPAFFGGAQLVSAILRPTPTLPSPNIGRKLDFLFGKSGGRNATRSQDMAAQLENIGIKDTAGNRQYVVDQLTKAFNGPASSPGRNGAVWRETVLIGPDGGAVGLNTLWRGEQLVTIIVKAGTGG